MDTARVSQALERRRFSEIGHIIFRAIVGMKTTVPFLRRYVARSLRINVDRQMDGPRVNNVSLL